MFREADQIPFAPSTGQVELLQILTQPATTYVCPGEVLPINSAIHQARLRAHYQKCRECPHREDTHNLSAETSQRLADSWKRKPSLRTRLHEGFRGVFLNEMSLQDVQQIAAGVCSWLWNQALQTGTSQKGYRASLVMGHDSRVMSLEVIQKAIRAVREQGANVIDVGEVSGPCLQFAVEQLQADAGIHATAAGEEAIVIGLDVYGSHGFPLSGESLHAMQAPPGVAPLGRCGRTAGEVVPFPARKAYLGSLWKYFQGLPALQVQISCQNEFIVHLLQDLQQELAVRFICHVPEAIDVQRQLTSAGRARIQKQIERQPCDLAVWLGEDGQACEFFDRRGNSISAGMILQKLSAWQTRFTTERPVVLLGEELEGDVRFQPSTLSGEREVTVRYRQSQRENFARGMKTAKAHVGYDASQRYWLQGSIPVCDGLASLGLVLQAMAEELAPATKSA